MNRKRMCWRDFNILIISMVHVICHDNSTEEEDDDDDDEPTSVSPSESKVL